MYLKSLELHGFKSFPEKTVLHFNPGTTIIVGPNGSGKSNITDAMRWVLGELSSKSLRGSKMEDVIFSGADGVRPMGFAEVSITFDNSEEPKTIQSEYDEITVTRRYYRAGDSAYFINRKAVRLKDIYELFMNTGIGREGYSIIGQGRISEIISKKSEERRSIFEESAGITKYRYRKNESQKKLGETENNMTRVSDIAAELEARIGPLGRDAVKARRYLELYDEKKKLDVSLWKYDMDRQRENLERTETDTKMSSHELEMADDTMKQLEAQIERAYERSHASREASQRIRDEINAEREGRSKLESNVRLLENNRDHAEKMLAEEQRLISNAEASLRDIRDRMKLLEERKKDLSEKRDESLRKNEEIKDKRAEALRERGSFDEVIDRLFRERQTAESELSELRVRLNVLKNSLSDQTEQKAGLGEEISGHEEEIARLEKSIAEEEEAVSEYESGAAREKERFDTASASLNNTTAEQEKLRSNLSSLGAEISALGSRISAMERMLEHFEGYNNSVRFIMKESGGGRLHGIHGPLSHLIKVDEKYALALETSMGAALQNIVTSDEASAKAAIAALKRQGAGRATFYPITTVRAQKRSAEMESASSCKGFIGFADELISCDAKYRDIVSSVVGRICVFDNIDNASDMARARGWRVRAVTLDGQQINAGGSFTGGSARRDSGMLTRNSQIDSLKKAKAEKEAEASKYSASLAELEKTAQKLRLNRADADEKYRLMNSLASASKTSLGELTARRDVVLGMTAKLRENIERFERSRAQGDDDIRRLNGQIETAEKKAEELISKRETAAVKRGEWDLRADELTLELSDSQISLAGFVKDLEVCVSSLVEAENSSVQLESEIVRRRGEVQRLTSEIEGAVKQSGKLLSEGRESETRLASLEEKRAELDSECDRIEASLNELRRREKEQSSKKEILFISHTKNENKLEAIKADIDKMTSRLWDEYELTYSSASELADENGYESVTKESRVRVNAALQELKSQIKSLGHVNISAIDEYAETKERYDYIKLQLDDLESSKRELEDIIREIEEDMRSMFNDAFEKINRNFGEVFRDLFGGGTAELTLTNPEDVLTSGIEISAAPPGKTIKSLSLLSGGEQAFIAIALMFALIKFNPAPFCIFDEIEAALDEVNVSRVANYVHKFSSEMQIIMITHRRGTMDIADTLYGVTMARRGISKVFTLDVNAADENDKFLKN